MESSVKPKTMGSKNVPQLEESQVRAIKQICILKTDPYPFLYMLHNRVHKAWWMAQLPNLKSYDPLLVLIQDIWYVHGLSYNDIQNCDSLWLHCDHRKFTQREEMKICESSQGQNIPDFPGLKWLIYLCQHQEIPIHQI